MEVTIGQGPDFCMRAGKVIYSHRLSLEIIRDGKAIYRQSVSDRSLAMIEKSIESVCKRYSDDFRTLFPRVSEVDSTFDLLDQKNRLSFKFKFTFPAGLMPSQASDLIDEFVKFFSVPK